MNIFYLSKHPADCAAQHCDQHVRKMCVEYAQMLSTAHHILDLDYVIATIYKVTHPNHRCNVWIRESSYNYEWLYELWAALLEEYKYRFKKEHAAARLKYSLKTFPQTIPDAPATIPPNCTPFISFRNTAATRIILYRKLYGNKCLEWAIRKDKKRILMSWTTRKPPVWMVLYLKQAEMYYYGDRNG